MASRETPPANDVSALSFEQAMKELEDIVRRLESGQVKLDEAVSAYERGAALKAHCEGQAGRGAHQSRKDHRRGQGSRIGADGP